MEEGSDPKHNGNSGVVGEEGPSDESGHPASSPSIQEQQLQQQQTSSFSQKWTNTINVARKPVLKGILAIADKSARNPWTTIILSIILTLGLLISGAATNLTFETDDDVIFTPFGALPTKHRDWIKDDSDFPDLPRDYVILIHQQGQNMLNATLGAAMESVERAFDALEALQETNGLQDLCPWPTNQDSSNAFDTSCPWDSVTQFFNNSRQVFRDQVQTNQQAIDALSASTYPDGTLVLSTQIFGKPVRQDPNNRSSTLISIESYLIVLGLPDNDTILSQTQDYEQDAIDTVFGVQNDNPEEWADLDYVVDQYNERSFGDEFARGFAQNIPLLIAAFTIMIVFTIGFFSQRNWVYSRASMGVGAVMSTTMGMLAGFGVMFIAGIPLTSITGMLPFILVGIGLDDAFIITSEYFRSKPASTNDNRDDSDDIIVQRVHYTIQEVGLSITTTTITTGVAFGLGATSSIPAVYWLCLYAIPAIVMDFVFAITFFVAIIVIDERRVQESRRDCLCCLTAPNKPKPEETENEKTMDASSGHGQLEQNDEPPAADSAIAVTAPPRERESTELFVDKIMKTYATYLLLPWVQVAVVISFLALLAGCAYSTSQLEQDFDVSFVLPEGSYVVSFLDAMEDYNTNSDAKPEITFRFVDQSKSETQDQMEHFINDLVELSEISDPPDQFWLRDFKAFIAGNTSGVGDLDFNDQIAVFLEVPAYKVLYEEDIARNANGDVTASRTKITMDQVDLDDVREQIDALENQEKVSAKQPVNQGIGGGDWPFFTLADNYFIWSFFASCPQELAQTTILGVVSVAAITILTIPHWSAVFFVTPLICILYVDLLGVLQFSGVAVNSISYITLTVSIGLMVDFLMHVLLRYYESRPLDRQSKVQDTLSTMGSSIFVGGFTTLLGTIPLAFSTLEIFQVVFKTFIALVTLGVAHGLIFLPVVMMMIGPQGPSIRTD